MREVERLDPEVEALIRELARDPRSTLLRASRRRRDAGLERSDFTALGWSEALREGWLGDVRRRQGADLALELYLARLFRRGAPRYAARWREASVRVRVLGRDPLPMRRGSRSSRMRLLRASLRAEPRELARVLVAVEQAERGEPTRVLGGIETCTSSALRPYVAQLRGHALSALGRSREALDRFAEAADLAPGWIAPHLAGWLRSREVGSGSDARGYADWLDASLSPSHPELDGFLARAGAARLDSSDGGTLERLESAGIDRRYPGDVAVPDGPLAVSTVGRTGSSAVGDDSSSPGGL